MMMNNSNLGLRPQQKIFTHILLAICTFGLGNLIYYISVKRKQEQWDATVQAMNNTTNHNYNFNK